MFKMALKLHMANGHINFKSEYLPVKVLPKYCLIGNEKVSIVAKFLVFLEYYHLKDTKMILLKQQHLCL